MRGATQLKALIRNMSKEKSIKAEIILRNYMMERLLERISVSEYRDKFILKGGMLVAAMVGIDARSTMDIDATIKGVAISEKKLEEVLKEILKVQVEDGVIMKLKGFESIRSEFDYEGIRVSIEAILESTKQTMKVDITTGDIITPREVEYSFKLLFEDRHISIMAYNLETILAEKLETILSRGVATTRMRDYYDIYVLTTLRRNDISWGLFVGAFKKTSEQRNTYKNILESGEEIIQSIETSKVLLALWNRYQQKNFYVSDLSWVDAFESVKDLYHKLKL